MASRASVFFTQQLWEIKELAELRFEPKDTPFPLHFVTFGRVVVVCAESDTEWRGGGTLSPLLTVLPRSFVQCDIGTQHVGQFAIKN
jgi:hypothetical protein